jgi:protein subunit release factor B
MQSISAAFFRVGAGIPIRGKPRGRFNILRCFSGENRGIATFRIDEKDLRESFVRGSGPGGQKINKTKNNVLLVHEPTGIAVQCQDSRDLTTNRKIARKLLKDKVDLSINGADSKLGKKYEKIRKRKKNAAR